MKQHVYYTVFIHTDPYFEAQDVLAQERLPGSRWVLHVFKNTALESKKGGLTIQLDFMARGSWARAYQCCRGEECSNWIWEDKVAEGYVCRKCGLAWRQPAHGFRDRSKSQPRGRHAPRQKPLTPPPGLGGGRASKISQVHKATTDLLMGSWGSLDPKLQQQLEQLGIKPAPPTVEADDLTSVLKENMAHQKLRPKRRKTWP